MKLSGDKLVECVVVKFRDPALGCRQVHHLVVSVSEPDAKAAPRTKGRIMPEG